MNGLALCAGIGTLDLGLRIATGGRYRVVCHVEREAYPAAALVARMADQALDQAPVWDDITTFDGRPWRGLVEVVTAGLPCQPYSLAGDRKGHDDERALWPEAIRIIEEVEPAAVFLENVPEYLKHFGPVWAELRRLGFECAPPLLLTAHELGGPHRRQRLFVLCAHPARSGCLAGFSDLQRHEKTPDHVRHNQSSADTSSEGLQGHAGHEYGKTGRQEIGPSAESSESATDSESLGQHQQSNEQQPGEGQHESVGFGQVPANTDSPGLTLEWSGWLFDRERQTLRHDTDRCGRGCRICGSVWETESPAVRLDYGAATRMVELRAIGNGVVPAMAAAAWRELNEASRQEP